MTAPWKRPGTGPESVDTFPRVTVSAVTPTSVAPPLPPAGVAALAAPPPVPVPAPLPPPVADWVWPPVAVPPPALVVARAPDDAPVEPPADWMSCWETRAPQATASMARTATTSVMRREATVVQSSGGGG